VMTNTALEFAAYLFSSEAQWGIRLRVSPTKGGAR
jgi:hypothetical protein